MCDNTSMTITAYSPPTQSLVKPGEVQTLALSWLASFGSPRTRQAYGEDLRKFTDFLDTHDAGSLLTASRVHLDLWARSLEAEGYSPATRARRLASVSSFYAYAASVGAVLANPVTSVRRPKLPTYSPLLCFAFKFTGHLFRYARGQFTNITIRVNRARSCHNRRHYYRGGGLCKYPSRFLEPPSSRCCWF